MDIVFISDTEEKPTLLRQWYHQLENEVFKKSDKIIHLGDGIKNIRELLPEDKTIYIKGNHDKNNDDFSERKVINFDGLCTLLVHGDRQDKIAEQLNIWINRLRGLIRYTPLLDEYYSKLFSKYKGKYDLVVYGHIHIPRIDFINKTIFFCPGSLSLKKSSLDTKPSFGVLEIRFGKNKKYLVFNVFSLSLKEKSPRFVRTLTKKIVWLK